MSTEQFKKDHEKLAKAYDTMLERVKALFEEASEEALPKVQHALDAAGEKAMELGELTREEVDKVSEYLRRDIVDAAEYLTGPEPKELMDWLKFDLQLIEAGVLHLFLSVADKTKLELMDIEERAYQATHYHTGEITGIGTLVCDQCGEQLKFYRTGHIPPCPKCHGTEYQRAS